MDSNSDRIGFALLAIVFISFLLVGVNSTKNTTSNFFKGFSSWVTDSRDGEKNKNKYKTYYAYAWSADGKDKFTTQDMSESNVPNLVSPTDTTSIDGTNGANQCILVASLADQSQTLQNLGFKSGDKLTVTGDVAVNVKSKSAPGGTFLLQFGNSPWGIGVGSTSINGQSKTYHISSTIDVSSYLASAVKGIQLRLDNVPTTTTVTVSNVRFQKANGETVAPYVGKYSGLTSSNQSMKYTDYEWVHNANYLINASDDDDELTKPDVMHTAYANIVPLCKENSNFTLSDASLVRYGSDSRWVYKELQAGAYTATNTFFGSDPASGTFKNVELVSDFSTVYPNLNLLSNTTFKNYTPKTQQYFSMAIKDGGVNNNPYVSVSYNNPTINSWTDTISWGFDKDYFKPSTTYTFSFYVKGTGTIRTHVYPSLIDTSSANGLADGNVIRPAVDGVYDWNLTSGWVRHTYTFTTKSSITANENFLFRIFTGNSVDICLPKVEEGSTATPWMPNASEVKASDQPKYIGTYTDKSESASQDPLDYTWKLNPDYHV